MEAPSVDEFRQWRRRFFSWFYDASSVSATFIGVHDRDHRLPDRSEHGIGDILAEIEALLDRARSLSADSLDPFDAIDLRLARGHLELERWEYQSGHFARGNPSFYTGEAIFGVLSLFLSPFGPIEKRVESAIARLEATPQFLADARANVRQAPTPWTERAIRECAAALAFLGDGIDLLIAGEGIRHPSFRRAADRAAAAFAEHRAQLESELLGRPTARYQAGAEALGRYLRLGHFLRDSAEDLAHHAEAELVRGKAYLVDHAADRADPVGLPDTDRYYARFDELWHAVRRTTEERSLLSWPDFPIRYVPRPAWVRSAAPELYFLYYRSPAAFDRPPVHDYWVTPIESDLPESDRRALLAANDESTIKLNHVIHHGSIGHHVQNWHAGRARSAVGRIAAVDGASRLAMFCGGTMAEGWACYATDLMADAGFLTTADRYAEARTRCRMCARTVVDVRLHTGQYSLDDAAEYYRREAGMPEAAAMGEAIKNSMFPGAATMYLSGTDAIHRLRRDLSARLGPRFDLKRFHDEFLSHGSIPVSLIAERMIRQTEPHVSL